MESVFKEAINFNIGTAEEHIKGPDPLLLKIFKPKSVAVVGATERKGTVGRTLIWNLLSSPFGGIIYPVNFRRKSVMGIKAYKSVSSIPEVPDLVVISTPAKFVPSIVEESGKIGVKGVIVISAGFSEAGEQGKKWADQIGEYAKQYKMRIIGPNCLGVMNPVIGLNATFAQCIGKPGKVAVISQSGALATAMLDFSLANDIGFSAAVSIGSMVDVGLADLIDYFGHDVNTESILIYCESIGDARKFISAVRRVTLTKPVCMIKVGKTKAGEKAAASHTGTLTGDSQVLEAAFERCGLCTVDTIEELFTMADALSKQPLPLGNRLCIVTNAGGPGALSVDALSVGKGQLSSISPDTMKKLNDYLPPHWSHNNPIDILGDAPPERYAKTLEILSKDPSNDALMVILTPQAMTDPTETAEVLVKYYNKEIKKSGKPLFAVWMGGNIVKKGQEILSKAGIPSFEFPDLAAQVFNKLWKYSKMRKDRHTFPEKPITNKNEFKFELSHNLKKNALSMIKNIREKYPERTILTEYESKKLLELYGIPITKMEIATTVEEAIKSSNDIGYPVVVKLHSETLTHKTDVGGVMLNIKNDKDVTNAFNEIKKNVSKIDIKHFSGVNIQKMIKINSGSAHEVILGSKSDSQVGPVILFGMGGSFVEIFKDTALCIPPIRKKHANKLINSTKMSKILKGYRGMKGIDMDYLENLLCRFSQLVTDLSDVVEEIDVNPLFISSEKENSLALDARIVMFPKSTKIEKIPKPAIRPYPRRFVKTDLKLNGDKTIMIRPTHEGDFPLLNHFFKKIAQSVHKNPKSEKSFNYAEALLKLMRQEERHSFKLDPIFQNIISKDKKEGEKEILEKCLKNLTLLSDSTKMNDILLRICMENFDQELVLLALDKQNPNEVLGIGMYSKWSEEKDVAELLITVAEEQQGKHLGRHLFNHLIECAKCEGIKKIICKIPGNNSPFRDFCKKNKFIIEKIEEKNDQSYIASLNL